MVRRLTFALPLLAASIMALPAYAQTEIEIDAPKAETVQSAERLEIKMASRVYTLEDPKPGSAERVNFEQLSQEEQKVFMRNRGAFLTQAAKALQMLKYGFGLGSVVKEKIKFGIRALKDESARIAMNELDPLVRADVARARDLEMEKRAEENERRLQTTLKQRSETIIQGFLHGLDQKLWSQALLFAHSNEFGVMASGGLEMLAGMDKKGWGGLFDIGISIGYNRDTHALAIQIYRDFEKFQSTTMKAVFVAGILGKAGMYMSNQRPGEMARHGISFYPPMIPGYSAMTPSQFQTGLSTGLTWPPSPLGDLLTYTNTLDNKVLLRFTFSPMMKGFVRMETGLGLSTLRFFVSPVEKAINSLRTLFFGSRLCGRVFLH